jgi:hypothetical protein
MTDLFFSRHARRKKRFISNIQQRAGDDDSARYQAMMSIANIFSRSV